MSDPSHLSERMPAVAHGGQAWTALDQRHLAACADCAAEWAIIRRAAHLGHDATASLDVAGIADRVLGRLRERPAADRRPRPLVRWALVGALAATLALAFVFRPDGPGEGPARLHALLPELEGLDAEEMEAMFEVLPAAPGLPEIGLPGLGELTEDEIESVLRTLEG